MNTQNQDGRTRARLTFADESAWHRQRAELVTASDVAPIIGAVDADDGETLSEWQARKTQHYVWRLKRGLETVKDNDAMRFGRYMERAVLEWFADETETYGSVTPNTQREMHVCGVIGATLDATAVEIETGETVAVEVKTTTARNYNTWQGSLPVSYYAQVQTQMYCAGLSKAVVIVCVLDRRTYYVYHVDYDAELMEAVREQCEAWHARYIAGDEEPPIESARDAEKRPHIETDGGATLVADEAVNAMLADYVAQKAVYVKEKAALESCEDALKIALAKHEALTDESGATLATFKTQERKSASAAMLERIAPKTIVEKTVTTSKFRVLRIKERGNDGND